MKRKKPTRFLATRLYDGSLLVTRRLLDEPDDFHAEAHRDNVRRWLVRHDAVRLRVPLPAVRVLP